MQLQFADPRDFTYDRHHTVDDKPFGDGPGMLMKAEPVALAIESLGFSSEAVIISPDPAGVLFDSHLALSLSKKREILFVCGRYEGIDERVSQYFGAMKVSLGSFVVSGGDLPAVVMADAIIRQIPGVLGSEESLRADSYSEESNFGKSAPNFTRPAIWRGLAAPEELTGGNHAEMAKWRQREQAKANKTEV